MRQSFILFIHYLHPVEFELSRSLAHFFSAHAKQFIAINADHYIYHYSIVVLYATLNLRHLI